MVSKAAYKLFHEGTEAFARAERQGFRLDKKLAVSHSKELTNEIEKLVKKVETSDFYKQWQKSVKGKKINMDSNSQLSYYLYKVKKLKPIKMTATGGGSTDLEALESLHLPELSDLLRIRKLKKLRDTYLAPFLREEVDGYIHPSYNLYSTSTYRSSADSPNFQNIPVRDEEAKKVIRTCLFPRPKHQLGELDFKSIEVGIGACYHKDPTMIKYIKDPTSDMHRDMAQQIFYLSKFNKEDEVHSLLRSAAKNGFVFPQFYGDYYVKNAISLAKWASFPLKGRWKTTKSSLILPDGNSLIDNLAKHSITSLPKFTSHLQEIERHFWGERFPVYDEWRNKWWLKYQKKGYLKTKTGFICSDVMGRNQVINAPIQGDAFHCLLWSFNKIDSIIRKQKWKTKLIGQIHDSIIFDIYPPEKDQILATALEVTTNLLPKAWPWIIVPLGVEAEICEIDESWYYKKKIKI